MVKTSQRREEISEAKMTTTLRLQRNTIADDIDQLLNRISNPGNAQKRSIADAIRRGFQDNFTTEGAAAGTPWPELSAPTVASRQALGFAGKHPILVRTGRYRDSFVRGGAQDSYENIRSTSGGVTIEAGSTIERGRIHEWGATVNIPHRQQARKGGYKSVGGATNVYIPPRPVTALGDGSVQRIVDVIDFVITQIEQNLGIR